MAFHIGTWWKNILLVVDEAANAVTGGAPDETISSRLGRWKDSKSRTKRWIAKPICWALDKIDPGHCDDAEANEKRSTHRPESLDDKPGD